MARRIVLRARPSRARRLRARAPRVLIVAGSCAVMLFVARCSKSTAPIAGPPSCSSISNPATPSNVSFEENFDNSCLASRGWYDNTDVVISNSEHSPGSTQSLQYHFLTGATTPVNGGAMRHKFTPSNSVYISYMVKYSPSWIGSSKPYHPHEFYVLSSLDGDYDGLSDDWLTLYLEENYQNGGIPRMALQDSKAINSLLGALPFSLIGITENRSVGGCNGVVELNVTVDCYNAPPWYNAARVSGPLAFQPTAGPGYKGDWNHVEAYFQLNTIADGVEQADGVMQYWLNGNLLIDRHDILFRTAARESLQLSQFIIAPYIGDGSPVDQTMWVDALTVAPARITTAASRISIR